MRYKCEVMYELSSLAVVNVRDLGNIKHAFKLLAFPDTRVFQCSSNSSKVRQYKREDIFFFLYWTYFFRKNGWINLIKPKRPDCLKNSRNGNQ